MKLFEVLTHHNIKKVKVAPKSGIWFLHQSADKFAVLKPQTYQQLKIIRPGYPVEDRKGEELPYKQMTKTEDTDKSFLYATIVNKSMFPDDYPGYTYFFKLTEEQIEKCVFDVVDKKKWMEPTLGKIGFNTAISIWNDNNTKFKSFKAKDIGVIYPRIEVIIPFDVTPTSYIPDEEHR